MSVQLDATRPAPPPADSYWDNPAANDPSRLLDPQPQVTADPAALLAPAQSAATGDAVRIEGTDTNPQQRSQGSTPDGKTVQIDPLHQGAEVSIAREQTLADAGGGRTYVSTDQVVLSTGAKNDDVQITQRDDGTLDVGVNGEKYEVRLGENQELTIRSGAGNDTINVASNVKVNIVVDGGAGDDKIATGAGADRIDGGLGNDDISTGAGRDDVFGNSGDDRLDAGSGDDVVYGGDGVDRLAGGDGVDFLEGGKGNDALDGGAGKDMLSGGLDDDTLRGGEGDDAVYTGAGKDTVDNQSGTDTVYAQTAADLINAAGGARNTVINVEISSSKGVSIEGSDAFKQRVGAEIDFLRSSPNGQQMLAEFDKAAARGNTVTIKELANEQNGYAQTFSNDADIVNGKPGKGGDVQISYNPSFHMAEFPAPVVVLYHEMSHSYNGVNGSFQPGTYRGTGPDDGRVPNAERQAVGLETSAPAYDFDGDPGTPKTTANPDHLTENGLRGELGLPDRPSYSL
ncbi:M91 family zinc metallopeptidase [Lysobacter gummosus]|uniref:M91 family zinc metallopeptidase n=1 Tax=Lysobacter gummosus TaxID=262324 RepID=A0ABY3XFR6_9GAMM|nr:M91 family zinc metallopeptidase [Lysobacter gummosus]ALN89881.1 hemolysin-type calcium-binding repeat family protein [Lysobacter gummosus]UNP30475.1 M91 family zinc metallopeptidase [Lysobacter gummosus]